MVRETSVVPLKVSRSKMFCEGFSSWFPIFNFLKLLLVPRKNPKLFATKFDVVRNLELNIS